MVLSPTQPLKALARIVLTEYGILVDWHPKHKWLPSVMMIALQLLRLSYTVLSESIVMC